MDISDHRPLLDEDDRHKSLNGTTPYPANGYTADPSSSNGCLSGYTLMVAGRRTGKTSFLRLLLDTCDISPTATKEQLASVAKFVQGCSGHTSHIRTASIDIELDVEGTGLQQRLALSLVDTPSIDFQDETSAERLVSEMLRHVDSRFAEGVEDDWKAQTGDHHVHLCIYFLDPDDIVPPSVPGPPAPLVPRARTNSFSQHEPEPVILEPPVTTNPLLYRPTLPPTEIATIRRLSSRVNVLPVIARADTLTNDRLTAVKMAIRRDLAEAGIGFGIFDIDNHLQYQHHTDAVEHPPSKNGDAYSSLHNGSSSMNNSPPTTPASPSFLRLPYALISPDIYSHSDGVTRIPSSRHELVAQYTPTIKHRSSKLVRGRFIRTYRWGSMDVLEPTHSDFLPLRAAIFHHMETLQKYTREYLYDKFRADYLHHHHPASHHSLSRHATQGTGTRPHPSALSHGTRPILAIDTAPTHSAINRHPSLSIPRDMPMGADMRSAPQGRAAPDASSSSLSARTSPAGTRSSKQRTKKITVACNFCRSRKLKCDGGRPACSQCLKRSNPCDYMPQNKRRGTLRQRKAGEESESDSGDERSAELDDPSLSPEVPSLSASRRSSNADTSKADVYPSSLSAPPERYREDPKVPSRALRSDPAIARHSPEASRSYFNDNELPHIATLSVPASSPSSSMPGPPLPPIRPASEQQAAQRKRAATVPGKSTRQPSNSGPKVVACNFCRSRKTKCDGTHPACSSCSRRSLPCSYVHDAPTSNGSAAKKPARRASTSKVGSAPSASSRSPPSHLARLMPTPSGAPNGYSQQDPAKDAVVDLKRARDDSERAQPPKKMRMDDSPPMVGIP